MFLDTTLQKKMVCANDENALTKLIEDNFTKVVSYHVVPWDMCVY